MPTDPILAAPVADAPEGASTEPRAGSSLHYALLGVDGERRSRTLARLALGRALVDVLLDVGDSGVARQKVHWWHEELDRLHAGEPRHPASVGCADLAGSDAARSLALELLGAAASERLEPAKTVEALDGVLGTIGGLRAALACDALDPSGGFLFEPARVPAGLAIGLARHERLARLPPLLARRHAVFSTELYGRHGLDPSKLLKGVRLTAGEGESEPPSDDGAKARVALLQEAVGLAEGQLRTGLAAREGPVPLRRLAALRLRQLELWRAKGTDLLRERRSLTPLRKAWIATRVR